MSALNVLAAAEIFQLAESGNQITFLEFANFTAE